jgi:hypothetical protein
VRGGALNRLLRSGQRRGQHHGASRKRCRRCTGIRQRPGGLFMSERGGMASLQPAATCRDIQSGLANCAVVRSGRCGLRIGPKLFAMQRSWSTSAVNTYAPPARRGRTEGSTARYERELQRRSARSRCSTPNSREGSGARSSSTASAGTYDRFGRRNVTRSSERCRCRNAAWLRRRYGRGRHSPGNRGTSDRYRRGRTRWLVAEGAADESPAYSPH